MSKIGKISNIAGEIGATMFAADMLGRALTAPARKKREKRTTKAMDKRDKLKEDQWNYSYDPALTSEEAQQRVDANATVADLDDKLADGKITKKEANSLALSGLTSGELPDDKTGSLVLEAKYDPEIHTNLVNNSSNANKDREQEAINDSPEKDGESKNDKES